MRFIDSKKKENIKPFKFTEEELANREPIEDIFQQFTSREPYFQYTSPLIHNPLSELPYFGINFSTLNLTFNSSLPTSKPIAKLLVKTITMASNNEILNYLKANTTGSILLRVDPFFEDRTQNPYTLMESFEKAALANNSITSFDSFPEEELYKNPWKDLISKKNSATYLTGVMTVEIEQDSIVPNMSKILTNNEIIKARKTLMNN
ncbi:20534_t:CDS:2 [Gigaspora margarita]|uniref:20534_t:CDS:1 n=1 Tax=Gigaspora margarita TaxID=4874 RepID=A0ABN7UUX1_GIGMA|nr:20534_t:CDS:2 [Gigaspora margarita]